jgi:hypothetical protein
VEVVVARDLRQVEVARLMRLRAGCVGRMGRYLPEVDARLARLGAPVPGPVVEVAVDTTLVETATMTRPRRGKVVGDASAR